MSNEIRCFTCGTFRPSSKYLCVVCTEKSIAETMKISSGNQMKGAAVGGFVGLLAASPVAHSILGMDKFEPFLALVSLCPGMFAGAFAGWLIGAIFDI